MNMLAVGLLVDAIEGIERRICIIRNVIDPNALSNIIDALNRMEEELAFIRIKLGEYFEERLKEVKNHA